MRDVFEGYGAAVEVDVYAAPEPVFKMLPKLADRTALRVASFSDTPMPASAVCEVAASGVGLADFSHHGVIAVSGADRYRFVNGLCTNKALDAKPGQALKSCFTNKLGRSVAQAAVTTALAAAFMIPVPLRPLSRFGIYIIVNQFIALAVAIGPFTASLLWLGDRKPHWCCGHQHYSRTPLTPNDPRDEPARPVGSMSLTVQG